MNKNIGVVVGVVVLLVIAGAVYATMSSKEDMAMKAENMDEKMMDDTSMAEKDAGMMEDEKVGDMEKADMMQDEAMKKDETMMKDEMMDKDEDMVKDDVTMAKIGSYEAYSTEKLAMAETGDVVIFFHASWCPSCRGLNSNIESNLSAIPAGTTILKADYDKETELKKKYGVTSQHTLVQVDKDGNLIKKWSGSSSLDKLIAQIQ